METAKTVDRAARVLLAVGQFGPATVAQIAERLSLNRTVTYRLLTTLEKHGLARATAQGYVPGSALLEVARRVEPRLLTCAQPVMDQLSTTTGETVVLAVAQGAGAVAIDQVVATVSPLRVDYQLGTKSPLTQGASGRVLLTLVDQEIREMILATATDPRRLKRELGQIDRRGYASSTDELQTGIYGIAVPVTDRYCAASISVLAPTSRAARLDQHLDSILEAGRTIEAALKDL